MVLGVNSAAIHSSSMVNPNLYLHIIPFDWGNSSHSCMPSSIWPPYPNTLSLFAQKLKRSSTMRAGPKRLWIRCTRWTVSSRSRSERLRWEIVSAAPSCVCSTLTEPVIMTRVARKDYTFADGTRIPQGTTVSVNPTQAHHDLETYKNHPNSLKVSASRKCGSSRIVGNMILLPPPQSYCLSDTGVLPVLDATSQLASSSSCSRTPFSTVT